MGLNDPGLHTFGGWRDHTDGNRITTTRGGRWESRNLARTLGNPLYGGKLAYKGEIVGTLAGVEPIMDRELFDAVQAKLGARRRGRKASGRYPLRWRLRVPSLHVDITLNTRARHQFIPNRFIPGFWEGAAAITSGAPGACIVESTREPAGLI